ncbi:hypothetical protein [Actomonas aquatica]|uniref:Tetratricopeptide repeat protein n=1 Tax=Actomonas aquatica TaxID=2866162 RepID=A0ABZ1CAN7_9BACT|nr:hypothetical protein [Opitutus sp. WL0086]WRQ88654.1 hypothetical protein K1X11_004510 [Opitutus sp. WL0086]
MRLLPPSWRERFESYLTRLSAGERARVGGLVVLVACAILAIPAWKLLSPVWRDWRVNRALEQASASAEAGNYRALLLHLQRASQLAPSNLEVWSETAGYLSALGQPDTLVAYENLLRLGQNDVDTHYQLAREALRFDSPERARDALASLQSTPDLTRHQLTAAVALRLNEPWVALAELQAALALAPDNPEVRYNLSVLQLNLPDAHDEAQARLLDLRHNADYVVRASVALLRDAGRQRDATTASTVITGLVGDRANTYPDSDQLFAAFLQTLQSRATTQPTDVATVARWMVEIGRVDSALEWITTLPTATDPSAELAPLTAELALRARRLDVAAPLLMQGTLGPLAPETVVLALAAQEQLRMNKIDRAQFTWSDAVTQANAAPSVAQLRTLARIAATGSNNELSLAPLQSILKRDPTDTWAFTTLLGHFTTTDRRRDLQELLDERLLHQPSDLIALQWAVRLHATSPIKSATLSDPVSRALSTAPADSPVTLFCRALLVQRQHHTSDAAAIWQQVPAAALTLPEFRHWGAVIAVAAGDTATARLLLADPPSTKLLNAEREQHLQLLRQLQ